MAILGKMAESLNYMLRLTTSFKPVQTVVQDKMTQSLSVCIYVLSALGRVQSPLTQIVANLWPPGKIDPLPTRKLWSHQDSYDRNIQTFWFGPLCLIHQPLCAEGSPKEHDDCVWFVPITMWRKRCCHNWQWQTVELNGWTPTTVTIHQIQIWIQRRSISLFSNDPWVNKKRTSTIPWPLIKCIMYYKVFYDLCSINE